MLIPVLVQTYLVWSHFGASAKDGPWLNCSRLRKVVSLGMKGILLTCGEIWAWEIQILFCSVLGPVSVAAYTISFNFYSFLVMVPVGLRTGLAVTVGFHIGQGNPSEAATALRQSLYYLSGVACIYFVALVFFGQQIAFVFSTSPQVLSLTAQCLFVIAFYQAFDGAYVVLVGALLGVGQQGVGAQATLAFYIIGLPAALFFAFKLQGGAAGLWLGMGIANVIVFLLVLRRICNLEFAHEVDSAKAALLADVEPGGTVVAPCSTAA